jgi:hypothetical protein
MFKFCFTQHSAVAGLLLHHPSRASARGFDAYQGLAVKPSFRPMTNRIAPLLLSMALCPGLPASQVGKDWGVEREAYIDPVTGARIWEMTRGNHATDNL